MLSPQLRILENCLTPVICAMQLSRRQLGNNSCDPPKTAQILNSLLQIKLWSRTSRFYTCQRLIFECQALARLSIEMENLMV